MRRGEIISGYELISQIAEGGMGTIWRARHPHLDRQVALKFIRADVRDDSAVQDAFVNEVKNLSRLHSPHVVQVTDSGFTHDGSPFMVTEFLEGEDLRARLERERKLSIRDAVTIGIDVLKALSEAHALGLVHRDLKPGNIFLQELAGGQAEAVKVLDFGVAKFIGQSAEAMMMPSRGAKGSPRYMAPEQIVGDPITPATDVYSFGATLYRALTGEHVFKGTPVEVLQRHIDTHPIPIRQMDPDGGFDEELEDIVMICLRKDPNERPSSAAALKTRLEIVLSRIHTLSASEILSGSLGSKPDEKQKASYESEGLPAWLESTSTPPLSDSSKTKAGVGTADKRVDDDDRTEMEDRLELDWDSMDADRRETVPEHDIPAHVLNHSNDGDATDVFVRHDLDDVDATVNESAPQRSMSQAIDFDKSRTMEDSEPVAMLAALRESNSFLDTPADLMIGSTSDRRKPVTAPTVKDSGETIQNSDSQRPLKLNARRGVYIACACLGLVAVIAFALKGGPSKNAVVPVIVEADADLAKWIEEQGLRIREEANKVRETPSVVRHFEKAPDPVLEYVQVTVNPGPARFTEVGTNKILCDQVVTCKVPVTRAVQVYRQGFRPRRLTRDDLYDRRNGQWRVILRR